MMSFPQVFFKEVLLDEFILKDLSDAGQLPAFRTFLLQRRNLRDGHARLRVMAPDGFMPTALYWHWVLNREALGATTVLDGFVALPGLVVWTAGAGRIIAPNARVLTGWPRAVGNDAEAAKRLMAAMCCTEAEERAGFRQRTAETWLTRRLILGPDQLRPVFCARLEATGCPHCGK